MMTGMPNAQAARPIDRRRSVQGARGRVCTLSRPATIIQVMTSDTPISRPGTMPAMNSWLIDTFAATPKMMKAIDGGMTGAITPPAAIRPADRGTL